MHTYIYIHISEIAFKIIFVNSDLTYIFLVCLNRNERQIIMSLKDFKKYIFILRE